MTGRTRLIVGGILVGLSALVPATGLLGGATDDVFITYRYAWNLSHGDGFTFNPGERVFAASDPGVVLILAALRWATGLAPHLLGTVVTAGALCLIAGLALREAGGVERTAEAIAGGILLVISPYLWLGQGSGPAVALAILLLGATLAERRPWVAGLVSGLGVWCRPEALLGLGLLCLLFWFRDRRSSMRFGLAATVPVAIGLLLARTYFGAWLPLTLALKRTLAVTEHVPASASAFWTNALDLFGFTQGRFANGLLLLGACGCIAMARRAPLVGRFVVLYACLIAVLYSCLRLPLFSWYAAPAVVAVLLGAGWAIGGAVRAALDLRRGAGRAVLFGLIASASIVVSLVTLGKSIEWARHRGANNWRLTLYRAAGEWLAEHAPPDADVAFNEVGMIGYFGQRHVLDLVGLVSPGSVPFSTVGDPLGAFLRKPTRYVLFHSRGGGTGAIVRRPWFGTAYREVARLDSPEIGWIAVYEKVSDGSIPGARKPRPRTERVADGEAGL